MKTTSVAIVNGIGLQVVVENELNKALAMTFEKYDAERRQLTIQGFE